MKKIAQICAILMLIAFSATSQPYRWLPVQVAVNKCGFSVDSSAIYAIAENKRLAIDCYEDAYLRDSIICQQEKEIAMQNTVYERLLTANADLQSTVYKQATTLAAEKPKKWRWAGVACGVGFILGLLIN